MSDNLPIESLVPKQKTPQLGPLKTPANVPKTSDSATNPFTTPISGGLFPLTFNPLDKTEPFSLGPVNVATEVDKTDADAAPAVLFCDEPNSIKVNTENPLAHLIMFINSSIIPRKGEVHDRLFAHETEQKGLMRFCHG